MPAGDGTGPRGMGPMTGRGRGWRLGFPSPVPAVPGTGPSPEPETETEALKTQVLHVKQILNSIRSRISELETPQTKKD